MGRKKKINDQKSPQKQSHKEVNAVVNYLVMGVVDMEQKDARAQLGVSTCYQHLWTATGLQTMTATMSRSVLN